MLHGSRSGLVDPPGRSTATACEFIVTSSVPCTAASATMLTRNNGRPSRRPVTNSTRGIANKPTLMTRAVPTRATRAPTNCIATSAEAPNSMPTKPS